jgi:UDP-N-acetylglucosamine:LPS N-acetylglucosamine transferase
MTKLLKSPYQKKTKKKKKNNNNKRVFISFGGGGGETGLNQIQPRSLPCLSRQGLYHLSQCPSGHFKWLHQSPVSRQGQGYYLPFRDKQMKCRR